MRAGVAVAGQIQLTLVTCALAPARGAQQPCAEHFGSKTVGVPTICTVLRGEEWTLTKLSWTYELASSSSWGVDTTRFGFLVG